ncbi:serine hydrolase [Streptomyces filamentosus]
MNGRSPHPLRGAGLETRVGEARSSRCRRGRPLRVGHTPADGGTVLTPESVALMRQPGRLHPSGAETGCGLGWRVGGLEPPLDTAVWHTGPTPGYSAMVFLLPDQDLALVLQQNL